MSEISGQRSEKLNRMLFALSVLGCVAALLLSCLTHDCSTGEDGYLYVAFVVPSVIFFALLVVSKMKRAKLNKNEN